MISYSGQHHGEYLCSFLSEHKVIQLNVGVEVGVRFGDTTEYLLTNFPSLTLYLVDPYTPYQDLYDYYTQEMQDEIFKKAEERLRKFRTRFAWILKNSIDASVYLKGTEIDFVFIDAVHEYQHVIQDIHAWYPKIRKGGYLTGHDYSIDDVKRAVDIWAKTFGKKVSYSGMPADVWTIEM